MVEGTTTASWRLAYFSGWSSYSNDYNHSEGTFGDVWRTLPNRLVFTHFDSWTFRCLKFLSIPGTVYLDDIIQTHSMELSPLRILRDYLKTVYGGYQSRCSLFVLFSQYYFATSNPYWQPMKVHYDWHHAHSLTTWSVLPIAMAISCWKYPQEKDKEIYEAFLLTPLINQHVYLEHTLKNQDLIHIWQGCIIQLKSLGEVVSMQWLQLIEIYFTVVWRDIARLSIMMLTFWAPYHTLLFQPQIPLFFLLGGK